MVVEVVEVAMLLLAAEAEAVVEVVEEAGAM